MKKTNCGFLAALGMTVWAMARLCYHPLSIFAERSAFRSGEERMDQAPARSEETGLQRGAGKYSD